MRALLGKIHALLDIEWIYESETNETRPSLAAAVAAGAVPQQGDIDDLIRLGQIGYVRGIQEKLAEIEAQSSAHRDFTGYMKELIDGFDLNRYVAVLEQVRSRQVRSGHD